MVLIVFIISVRKNVFTTSDTLNNIFLINAGHFLKMLDMKAQLKLIKMTGGMLANVRQM